MLERETWRFAVNRETGAWSLADKRSGVVWTSDAIHPRFAQVVLQRGDRSVTCDLNHFDNVETTASQMRLVSRPQVDGRSAGVSLAFTVEPADTLPGLRLSFAGTSSGDWRILRVRPLADALGVTESDQGVLYAPVRTGRDFPAAHGQPGCQTWNTYGDWGELSMAMCGAAKQGSALLANWEEVNSRLSVNTDWLDVPTVPGRRLRTFTLEFGTAQGVLTLHPLGPGGYVEIARAYRPLAKAKGWLKTWAEKRREYPTVDRLFGAANFKMGGYWPMSHDDPTGKGGRVTKNVSMTFEQVAECAEHWRNELGIDRAYVVIAGWGNQGYDNAHPDILPACARGWRQ